MDDIELYGKLSALTKNKELWKENIDQVGMLLFQHSSKITAKALWMLGEMGLQYPEEIQPFFSCDWKT